MTVVFTDHDPVTGISSRVHELDGRTVIEAAADARQATEGQRWGEMRHVGFIPMAELGKMMRQDGSLDKKRTITFLKENPALVTFSKLLK